MHSIGMTSHPSEQIDATQQRTHKFTGTPHVPVDEFDTFQ